MLLRIATVVTATSRLHPGTQTRRTRYWHVYPLNRKGVVHFETYCRQSRFSDAGWAMISTSTAKITSAGAAAKAETPLLPYDCGLQSPLRADRSSSIDDSTD
jgi:hypothetical protein